MTRIVEAFGQTIVVRSDEPRFLALLDAVFPPLPVDMPSRRPGIIYRVVRTPERGRLALVRGRRLLASTLDVEAAAHRLAADLAMTLSHLPHRWTFLHAGVVAVNGSTLVFPGVSGAGKTTLVTSLLACGATYGSDEFAVLDGAASVIPYARWLHVRRADTRDLVDPRSLNAAVLLKPQPVSAVFLTTYTRSAGDPESVPGRRLTPAAAALRLLPHCLAARVQPARTLAALRALTLAAPVFEQRRSEAAAFARELVAWTGRRQRTTGGPDAIA